jgi:hypothetical protein
MIPVMRIEWKRDKYELLYASAIAFVGILTGILIGDREVVGFGTLAVVIGMIVNFMRTPPRSRDSSRK